MTYNTLLKLKSCLEDEKLVVYALSKAVRDNLITALDNEFCDEEVSEAKKLLWKVSGDGILGQFIK